MTTKKVEIQKRSDNFRKIAREPVETSENFETEPVKALYKWWSSFQPSLPLRSDFDIAKHWGIAPNMYVVQVLGPENFLYRLNGEKVVDIVGASLRGHKITPKDPLLENRLFVTYLEKVVASRTAWHCSGAAEVFGKHYLNFESVDCPVTNENGEISFILGALSTLS